MGGPGGALRALAGRAIRAETWAMQAGLALLATFSAAFFLLPAATFAAFPWAYARLRALADESAWGLAFAAVAALTWAAAAREARRDGHTRLWRFVFLTLHGPLWLAVGLAVVAAEPRAYFPWWSFGAFLTAEWVAVQPALAAWLDRRGAGGGGDGA